MTTITINNSYYDRLARENGYDDASKFFDEYAKVSTYSAQHFCANGASRFLVYDPCDNGYFVPRWLLALPRAIVENTALIRRLDKDELFFRAVVTLTAALSREGGDFGDLYDGIMQLYESVKT